MGNPHLLKEEFTSTLSSFNSSHSSLSLSIGNIASLLVKIEAVMTELTIKENELKKYEEDLKIRVKDINERERKVKEGEDKWKQLEENKCNQIFERMETSKELMLNRIKVNVEGFTKARPSSPSAPPIPLSPSISSSPSSPSSTFPPFPSFPPSISSSPPHPPSPLSHSPSPSPVLSSSPSPSPSLSLSPSPSPTLSSPSPSLSSSPSPSPALSLLSPPTSKRQVATKYSHSAFSFSSSPQFSHISSLSPLSSSSSLPSQTVFLSMAINSCPPWGLSINKWFPDKQLHLLFKASRDGWSNDVFHKHCDKKGPTLTIIESKGYIFGGYSPADWESSEYKSMKLHKDSFIFTLSNPHSIPPTKYSLQPNAESSIANGKGSSIIFGNDGTFRSDIYVNLSSVKVFLDFPLSYSDTTGKGSLTFSGSRVSDLKNVLVFSVKP